MIYHYYVSIMFTDGANIRAIAGTMISSSVQVTHMALTQPIVEAAINDICNQHPDNLQYPVKIPLAVSLIGQQEGQVFEVENISNIDLSQITTRPPVQNQNDTMKIAERLAYGELPTVIRAEIIEQDQQQ